MALAIYSGPPLRPSGVIFLNISLPASASSLVLNWPSMIGVSMAPGDSVFTRIDRSFSSAAMLLAQKRSLGSTVCVVNRDPFHMHARGHQHDRAAVIHQWMREQ